MNVATGHTAAQMSAEYMARMDEIPSVAYCAFCPQLRIEGTAAECREHMLAHRTLHHPKQPERRRRRGSLQRFVDPNPEWRDDGLARGAEVARMLKARANEEAA